MFCNIVITTKNIYKSIMFNEGREYYGKNIKS